MQRAEALRRDFHAHLGLGQATDVSDDRKFEAMGRLTRAALPLRIADQAGRSPLVRGRNPTRVQVLAEREAGS